MDIKTSDQLKNARFYIEYNIDKFKSNIDNSDWDNISRFDCPNNTAKCIFISAGCANCR